MAAGRDPGDAPETGGADDVHRFVEAGLELLGTDAGEAEIAVIEAVDAVYRPLIEALLAEGFDGIPHEPGADMSRPPRAGAER
jgi:hypothetical protein